MLEDSNGFLYEGSEEAIKRSLQDDDHTTVAAISEDPRPSGISHVEDVMKSDNMTVSTLDTYQCSQRFPTGSNHMI